MTKRKKKKRTAFAQITPWTISEKIWKIPVKTPHAPIHYSAAWREELQTPELEMPLDCPHLEKENVKGWRKTWNRFAHLGISDTDRSIPDPKRPDAIAYNAALTKGRLSNFLHTNTELAVHIKHNLTEAILAPDRYPDRKEVEETTDLQRELDQEEEFIANSIEGFVQRTGDFDKLNDYVNSDSRQLFVLTAPGGMGKSTLLGKWVDEYRKHDSVHARFIGQSDASSTVYSLLRFLLREMKEVYQELDAEIPEDPNELRRAWPDLLKAIGQRGKTVIVIDALNQLQSGLSDLIWLPRPLPENIKMIVSFKTDDEQSLQLHKQMESDAHVRLSQVKPFGERKDRENLVDKYLDQYWKDLDPQLLDALIGSPGAINPLYLKVVLSELRVFGAFANLAEKIREDFGDDPVSAFHAVLQRLETDPAYSAIDPKEAVSLLFGLLAHARHGLSVDELTGILVQALNLSDNEDARQDAADTVHLFLRQFRPFLARRERRYDYFYDSFRTAAQQRYAAPDDIEAFPKRLTKYWHRLIANYFESLPTWRQPPDIGKPGDPAKRKVAELPFHLSQAQEWSRLEKAMCDLSFIEAKCTAGMTYDLLADYHNALEVLPVEYRKSVAEFAEFVRSQSHVLLMWPEQAFQQAANTADFTAPARAALRIQALQLETRPWLQLVNKGQQHSHEMMMRLKGHTAPIELCSFSSDGSRIVSASFVRSDKSDRDNSVRLWNAATGAPIAILAENTPWWLTRFTFAPDGQRIAVLSAADTLDVWDVGKAIKLTSLPLSKSSDWKFHFSPKGGEIAVRSRYFSDPLRVWDVQSSKLLLQIDDCGVEECMFSNDENSLFTSDSTGGRGRLWDLLTGNKLLDIRAVSLCYSSQKNWIAEATEKSIRVWDAATGVEIAKITKFSSPPNWMAFTKNSMLFSHHQEKTIFSRHEDKKILLFDVVSGKRVGAIANVDDWPKEGTQNVWWTRNKSGVILLEVASGEKLKVKTFECGSWVRYCTLSPDGAHLLTVDNKNQAVGQSGTAPKLWDAISGVEISELPGKWTHDLAEPVFSPDGKWVVFIRGIRSPSTIIVCNPATGEETASFDHEGRIKGISFSSDGKRMVSSSDNGTIRIWDMENPRFRTLQHSGRIDECVFLPDGRRILTTHSSQIDAGVYGGTGFRIEGTLKMWDATNGNEEAVIKCEEPIYSVDVSPDGTTVAAAYGGDELPSLISPSSAAARVLLWSWKSGHHHVIITGEQRHIVACSFSPSADQLLCCSREVTLQCWNSATRDLQFTKRLATWGEWVGEEPFMIYGSAPAVRREYLNFASHLCNFAPNGKRIVSCSAKPGELDLIDALTGVTVGTLSGHTNWVRSCSFSPDGEFIVSGADDGALKLWNVMNLELRATFQTVSGVLYCRFLPDGNRVVSCHADRTLKLWDVPTQSLFTNMVGHTEDVCAIAVSPNGAWIASADRNHALRIWDTETGLAICKYYMPFSVREPGPAWYIDREVHGKHYRETHPFGAISVNALGQLLAIGDITGYMQILECQNIEKPPIITAWLSEIEKDYAFGCPFCRVWSPVLEMSLGSEVPCPNCGNTVKLNPFTTHADWRPIARAWGNKI